MVRQNPKVDDGWMVLHFYDPPLISTFITSQIHIYIFSFALSNSSLPTIENSVFTDGLKFRMLCRGNSMRRSRSSRSRSTGSVPVYLNVYDLTPINGYAYWLGLGVYHSGVQVHGVEYAFGSHEQPTTGIFEGEPKQCDGFTFRKQIFIGWTEMSPPEVRGVMEELSEEYKGIAYNLITKNCNHFCNDACIRLSGNSIPSWVNRLARIGLLCNCLIPVSLSTTKVGIEDKVCEGEKKKLTGSHSSRFKNSSSSSSSSSSSCSSSSLSLPPEQEPPTTTKTSSTSRSRSKSPLAPSTPLILGSPS